MANPAAITERPARECDCPPQTLRCAHINGERINLAFNVSGCSRHTTYGVLQATTAPSAQASCCTMAGWRELDHVIALYAGDSEADALAAFYAAEERLLRGEA